MSRIDWRRRVAGGALWTVVYNFLWGAAWFAFMRREWMDASAAIRRPLPWTAEVWFGWVLVTLPIGVAIVAYAAGRSRPVWSAACASLPMWLLLTVGMILWSRQESFSWHIITVDSAVNLVAMLAAALAGGWSQRES